MVSHPEVHPLCVLIRDLRKSAGWSLERAADYIGIPAVVLGSYERGDRMPPLPKLDDILYAFGYELHATPTHRAVVRLPTDMAAELRMIAEMLESRVPGGKARPVTRY
jgi:transcriptional regulator with XRE-family HTH domain